MNDAGREISLLWAPGSNRWVKFLNKAEGQKQLDDSAKLRFSPRAQPLAAASPVFTAAEITYWHRYCEHDDWGGDGYSKSIQSTSLPSSQLAALSMTTFLSLWKETLIKISCRLWGELSFNVLEGGSTQTPSHFEQMTQNYFNSSAMERMWSPELDLVLLLTTCVILGNWLNHSEPWFPQWNKDGNSTCLTGCARGLCLPVPGPWLALKKFTAIITWKVLKDLFIFSALPSAGYFPVYLIWVNIKANLFCQGTHTACQRGNADRGWQVEIKHVLW